MTDKLKLKSCHEVIDTVDVANVESIFYGKPTDPDILTVVMKDGKSLYCDEVCPVDSLQEEPKFKTGDRIKPIDSCLGSPRTIVDICDSWYVTDQGTLDFEFEDNWELVEHNHTDKNEPKFKVGDTIRLKNDGLEAKVTNIDESGFVYAACEDWEQIIDPSKWEIVHRTKPSVDEAMAEIERKAKLFTEANKGKTSEEILAEMRGEEPVSEGLEEESKEWLRPQLDKSYANYGEAKMMELTHFDGYAMLDAIEFGAKWQEAKDQEIIETAIHHAYHNGRLKMKEQMMAKAIDGKVIANGMGNPILHLWDKGRHLIGKKVKVIVIKED